MMINGAKVTNQNVVVSKVQIISKGLFGILRFFSERMNSFFCLNEFVRLFFGSRFKMI